MNRNLIGGVLRVRVCQPAALFRQSLLGVTIPLLSVTAVAQDSGPLRDPGPKTVHIVRADVPPVIDGSLDDAVWARAAVVDDLHQISPVEYAVPTERTEIYLLYDDDALYIGARLYDSDPENITANNLRQNDNIGSDDRFFVTLDPFNSRRSGYYFGVNPNGVREDGLYQNVNEFYGAWDGIFQAQASRFDGGWTAEMAIPFKTLSFDPNVDAWGLNFSRNVPRKDESMAWVSRNRRFDPSSSGLMTGLEGLNQGLGLDIVPSVSVRGFRAYTPRDSTTDFEPSLDLNYRLTPAMNASLTINTDFSATEVDDRQVNLTRFGLFFPEKRGFFLREADIFEFGRIGAQTGNNAISRPARENGRPFFSRRIGLSSTGEMVDIDYGMKISGRVGRWEIGALSIRQDEFGDVGADTLSVVRANAGVMRESSVGVIVTHGDPQSDVGNTLAGADFLYRNTRLPGGRTLEAELWYQQTDTPGMDGADTARGVGFRIPSSTGFRGGAAIKEFERNFNPALGYLNRRDVRDYSADIGYMLRPRTGYLQSIYFGLDGQRFDRLDGTLQSQLVWIRPFELSNRTGDSLNLGHRMLREVLTAPFEIMPGIVIEPGSYSFGDTGIRLATGNHRRLAGSTLIMQGDFYGGTTRSFRSTLTWRPSARYRGSITYDVNEVNLPQGEFTTRLVRLGFDVAFSSTLALTNLLQYDNVTETMGVNIRLHYIPEAGREMFVVLNHNFDRDDGRMAFSSTASDLAVKLNYTLRF